MTLSLLLLIQLRYIIIEHSHNNSLMCNWCSSVFTFHRHSVHLYHGRISIVRAEWNIIVKLARDVGLSVESMRRMYVFCKSAGFYSVATIMLGFPPGNHARARVHDESSSRDENDDDDDEDDVSMNADNGI